MLQKILVPLDGSELSDRILEQVRRLLVREDAEVTLIRVVTEASLESETSADAVLASAREHLERVRGSLRAQGARAESDLLVGDPASRINEFASSYAPSLIAMSTHGRTGLMRWVRGSVAERVLRTSHHPLLLSHPAPRRVNPATAPSPGQLRFRKVLVPLDGSDRAAAILPLVAEFARLYDAELILHHAVEVPPIGFKPLTILSSAEAQAALEHAASRVSGVRVRARVTHGVAAAAILDLAAEEQVDLVAIASHGRTGLDRWAFGSVAEHVVRSCTAPLLVKRVTGET